MWVPSDHSDSVLVFRLMFDFIIHTFFCEIFFPKLNSCEIDKNISATKCVRRVYICVCSLSVFEPDEDGHDVADLGPVPLLVHPHHPVVEQLVRPRYTNRTGLHAPLKTDICETLFFWGGGENL